MAGGSSALLVSRTRHGGASIRWVLRMSAFGAAAVLLGTFAPQLQAAVPANGRGWEMATFEPASSSRVLGLRPLDKVSDRFPYAVVGPHPGTESGPVVSYGMAQREPTEWVNAPLGFPYRTESTVVLNVFAPILPVAFSDDEEEVLWSASVALSPDAPPPPPGLTTDLYRDTAGGGPEFIARVATVPPLAGYPGFADIAADGSRVVFTSFEHLLPGDANRTSGRSTYAWDGSGLELVDANPLGSALSACGSEVSKANGMSGAGDRVFFSVPASCNGVEKVYLKDFDTGTTVQISASECTRGDCNAAANVFFAGATEDGDFAFLTTTQQLTDDDRDAARDLYRYNVEAEDLTLLSRAPSEVTGAVVGNVEAFPSDDGGRTYFRASGEMLPGESIPGEKLFVADASGVRLVGPAEFPASPQIQLSADGGQALFVTNTRVLEGDTDANGDAYLYDAEAESLIRISTGPAGGNGASSVSIDAPSPANLHAEESGNLRPYYAITAAGDRAFFQTDESLVAEDTNGVLDVYEWWEGEARLITPGYQPLKSEFGGISRDGRAVAFATNATLVSADIDGDGRDIYIARLGGGFPEPVTASGCDPASCAVQEGGRIERPIPASMKDVPSESRQLRVIGVAARARKGRIAVFVSAPTPGSISGRLWIRRKERKVVIARGSADAERAGRVRLLLRLTPAARRSKLRRRMRMRLTVSGGSLRASRAVRVRLR